MTEMIEVCIFELVSCLIRDESCTCEYGEIFEHFFFLVTKTRSLDAEDGEDSFELVEDDSCECLSIDIICDDDEFTLATLSKGFQYSKDILE